MDYMKLNIEYVISTLNELDDADRKLVAAAMDATGNSYAPYSCFNVGAAVLLADGKIVIGANQENAAFPSSLCAERTAVFSAQANYPDQSIVAIAIAARNSGGFLSSPITPCGSCRQVLSGIEDRYGNNMRVLLYGTEGVYVFKSVKDLLPFTFVDDALNA